jgi:hypothetical protein
MMAEPDLFEFLPEATVGPEVLDASSAAGSRSS